MYEGPNFSISLYTHFFLFKVNYSDPNDYEVVSHYGFELYFSYD